MSASIVGAWRVTVTIAGGPPFLNLSTFTSDGTVMTVFPSPSPAPEGAPYKQEFHTPAMGSWVDAGAGKISLIFESLAVDEAANPIGSHVIRATVEVTETGWSGPFTLDILDPTGKTIGSVTGVATGARITV